MTDTPPPTRYAWLDFNAPLSDARARRLVERLARPAPATVLDFGCGWGELLLRLLAAVPGAVGTGIDTDRSLLARGRANAAQRGLADRAAFVEAPAAGRDDTADLVVCVGASHAFGDTADALGALRRAVRPGGRALFGDGFWERTPTPGELAEMWPNASRDDYPDLAGLVDLAVDAGFRPLWVEAASGDEWHDFESGFLADREHWLLTHGDRPEAEQVRASVDRHRARWLRGYRGVWGFGYLTLGVPES
ncbi:SAM-dependent methyltransferase [Marinitenerispora sediminis]|uniref:SAM-dependent methyltransferase n=1 Tax=Marinitenerispora sediminis TaxID=1931232 RepID=A0A368SZZ4_9ACTN|nr:class I SAM-dependent methyltransferase [Marinitenerispora sediminis]RCV49385.1 SAM-dependent methyltransferase [Marinitenerispora sediminis]RCV51976.1 SAM-dependent methyltransferase [Marinitenerispora sediminis]RCV52097.1 SAM-dependent methyltransferase [Marinitenerispora sediminis]